MSDERRDYAVLISLMTREEAEVAAGALRADGIDAFIGNSNHAYTEWLLTPAFGGLQVFVPWSRVDEAKDLLRSRIAANAGAYSDDIIRRRDKWKIWVLFAGFYGVGLLYMYAAAWSLALDGVQIHIIEWIGTISSLPLWW